MKYSWLYIRVYAICMCDTVCEGVEKREREKGFEDDERQINRKIVWQ